MKTRGKVNKDPWSVDYSKDPADSKDLQDDGADANGYPDEKADNGIPTRGDSRTNRNAGNKRPGRMPRVGATKGRSDKNTVDPAEFREVVEGFFEFIEELNKGRKKTDRRKPTNDIRVIRQTEEQKMEKRVKFDTEATQAQSSEKFELKPDAFAASSKADKNPLYRYKEEDVNTGKELLNLLKDQNKEPANLFPGNIAQAQTQEPKTQRETETARRDNQPLMDFNPKYPHLQQFPAGNIQSYNNPLIKQQPTKPQQQQPQPQPQPQNMYGGFDFNNPMYSDVLQRMRMQQQAYDKNPMPGYFMPPYDNYQKLLHNELLSLQLLDLLQKPMNNVPPPHGTASLFENLSREFPMMNPMELSGQRYPNQSIGMELIQNGSTVMNPKTLEGKLGRAATHVAIAYFIYFKSLDPDTIAKSDKSKMDPTYNARMLKEKKHDTDSLETYLAQNLAKMAGNPFDYFGNAGLQRFLPQGNPDQLRELQLQRMQQEALLRNEELMQLRNAGYQGATAAKNDTKQEEEAQKRRQEQDRNRQQQVKAQPKEEEIIEIKEGSEGEQEADKQTGDQKNKGAASAEPKSAPQQQQGATEQMVTEKPTEDNQVSAEDIVEEITELTGLGQDGKAGQRKKNGVNNNNTANAAAAATNKTPVNKEVSEIKKPEEQEAEKPSATNEEAKASAGPTEKMQTEEPETEQAEQEKNVQVISIEESPAPEQAQGESSQPPEEPKKDETQ